MLKLFDFVFKMIDKIYLGILLVVWFLIKTFLNIICAPSSSSGSYSNSEDESIVTVVPNGACAIIYGTRGRSLGTVPLYKDDELLGYTSSTVSVRRPACVCVYDAHGRFISSYAAFK